MVISLFVLEWGILCRHAFVSWCRQYLKICQNLLPAHLGLSESLKGKRLISYSWTPWSQMLPPWSVWMILILWSHLHVATILGEWYFQLSLRGMFTGERLPSSAPPAHQLTFRSCRLWSNFSNRPRQSLLNTFALINIVPFFCVWPSNKLPSAVSSSFKCNGYKYIFSRQDATASCHWGFRLKRLSM